MTIAGMILKDPRSSFWMKQLRLWMPSEKMLQDAMHKVMDGRTSFVIAHRLSTLSEIRI